MPSSFISSSARIASVTVNPNLERYPPELFQRPSRGWPASRGDPSTANTHLVRVMHDQAQLGVLLDDGMIFRPSLLRQHRHLDVLVVFESVAMMGVSYRPAPSPPSARLGAGFEPNL